MSLRPRLKMVADMVRSGSRIADIGTDHGYLPAWLVKSGKCTGGIAADLRKSPLENAAETLRIYDVEDKISLRLSEQVRGKMLRIGITSAFEQLILQSGATLTAKIISVLPTKQIAALQITSNLESLAWSSGDACCTAATSLFGKSLGERSQSRARAYLRLSEKWALLFSTVEMLIFCLGGGIICRLFTNDVSIYGDIVLFLRIAAIGLPFINTHKTVGGALRGAGDSFAPLISSLISLWVFRVALGYVLISVLCLGGAAYRWSLNADQFVRMTAMLIFYLSGHWKKYAEKGE